MAYETLKQNKTLIAVTSPLLWAIWSPIGFQFQALMTSLVFFAAWILNDTMTTKD